MEYQLRHYVLEPGSKQQFIEEWRELIVPTRRALGFEVIGAWEVDGDEFVWIVGYDGEEGYAAAEEVYAASPERQAIDPERDPKRHVTDRTFRIMRAVDF
jgi:NIPSNAP